MFSEFGSGPVNRGSLICIDRTHVVDRLAEHVQHAPQRLLADGDSNRLAQIVCLHAAHQPVGRLQRDGAHAAFANVLRHFGRDIDLIRHIVAFARDVDRVVDLGHVALGKLDFNGGTGHLHHTAFH